MKTAVVGGGIAGLVAAHELVKSGQRPLLLEPGPLGGMVRSVSQGGFTLELGPNVLVERTDMRDLLKELHLADRARYPAVNPYGQFVWCRGRAMKVPQGVVGLIGSPLFSLSTKLLLPFRLLKPGLLASERDDLSVLELFTPLLGEQTTRDLLDPVLKGIYGGDVARLSARTIFPGLWEAAQKGLSLATYMRNRAQSGGGRPSIMVIEGGAQVVADTLVERVQGRADILRNRVERLERIPTGGYRLVCSEGISIDVDACVVTPAGRHLGRMLHGLDSELSTTLQQLQYASLGVVHLAVPRTEALIQDAFGVLFQGGMPNDLLGVMFNSQIFPHVAPADKHLLTVIVGGAQAGTTEFDEEGLKARLPQQISRLLGISSMEWLCFTAWRDAIPQLNVGHYKVVASLDEFESANPGLVIAGVDRGGVGVTDRVRIARAAVERVVKRVGEYRSVA